MHDLQFVVASHLAIKSLWQCKVAVLGVIDSSVFGLILWAKLTGRLKEWLLNTGVTLRRWYTSLQHLVRQLRAYLVTVLGGYDPIQVNWLIYRAALLSQQATSGKYSAGMKPVIDGQIQYVQTAICKLDTSYEDQFRKRRKSGLQRVEIVNGAGEGTVIADTYRTAGEVRDSNLLAAPPGSQG